MTTYQDLQDVQPILKNKYTNIRKKGFPLLTPLLAQVKKAGPDRVRYGGNDLFFGVKLGRRGGFVASAEGFLPDAMSATERQGRLSVSRIYARVAVDTFAAKASEDPKSAFISLANKVVEDVMDEWQLQQNRVLHGDGMAVRAIVVSRTSATVVTADSPYGIASSGPGNLHLDVGEVIATLDASDSFALLAKDTITAITLSTDTATITVGTSIEGSGTIAAGDVIVTAVPTATSSTDTSFGAEPYGIMAITDVEANFATFEGIEHSRWVAQKLTSTSIDETVVMKLLNTQRARGGVDWRVDASAVLGITSTGIWQQYGEALLGLRRFSAPEMTLNGGFKAIKVAGIPVVDDPWCPRGRFYSMVPDDLIFVDLMDFGKLSYEDSPTWRPAANQDGFEAVYATYMGFGCTRRNTQGVISGITDTVNYSPVY